MKKVCDIINAVMFFGFIAAFFVLALVLPKEDFSESENRYLAELPEFSAQSYFSGEFIENLSEYMDDHFPARRNWISLRTRLELLQGKKLVNGVCILGSPYEQMVLIEEEADYDTVDKSIAAINDFAESIDAPVYLMVAPTAAGVYADVVPDYSETLDQQELINYVYENTSDSGSDLDVFDALKNARDNYIYYRTDHHWTSRGAYIAYVESAAKMGFTPASVDRFNIMHASHSFYGSLHSKTLYNGIEADTVDFYISNSKTVTLKRTLSDGEYVGSPFLSSYLSYKDKYLSFLGENAPLVSLRSDAQQMKMLVIKDSYANCFVPFLAENCSDIDVIDLRYMTNPADYVDVSEYDCVLILYNADNFATDTNPVKLNLIN